MDVPSTGHSRQMSAEPMSESDSDAMNKEKGRHTMPHNEHCESPIVSGGTAQKERLSHSLTTNETRAANLICRERKKKPACLDGKQAGVNIARRNTAESRTDRSSYRVIEKAKGGPENPETLDRCANPEDRPSLVDAILFLWLFML